MKSRTNFIKDQGFETTQGRDTFLNLQRQCQAEYTLAWTHQKPKKDEWEVRLRLYNNQRRDKKAVGDTTMFATHQTILASLYVDRLNSSWTGKEEGDEDVADNLDALSQSDYVDMRKDQIDYDWDWDTCFFGWGIVGLEEYIRDPEHNVYLPVPHEIDPVVFLRDPYAVNFNGDLMGRGKARNFGFPVKMTKDDLRQNPHIFDDVKFEDLSFSSGTMSILQDAITARGQAQGNTNVLKNEAEARLGANSQYEITEWHTHYEINGEVKKVKVWLANDRSKVIGVQVFDVDYWKFVKRSLYPHSHDWDGTSIPDLTEDKQRARAMAQNLGLDAMEADLYPMYIYNSNQITNRKDLNFKPNKFIPVDPKGEPLGNSIYPMNKAHPNMQLLEFIYTSLDLSSQKATATSDVQQGIQSTKNRPLGETNLIAGNTETRYSLSAKIFGMSEMEFWILWYRSYKENYATDIDGKVLRIVGAFGAKWRTLGKNDIITQRFDPDVTIESTVLSRAKQLEERSSLKEYLLLVFQDPTANRRYGLKRLGRTYGLPKDEIERLLPLTIDERIAEDQNDLLNDNKTVPVLAVDDHNVHLEIHSKAKDTPATFAHIFAHKSALSLKKSKPELFPQNPQGSTTFTPTGTKDILPAPMGATQNQTVTPSSTSNQPTQ
jgi:hypothetical protein